LDSVAREFGAPDLVKIDVEGAEELVFFGAAELIRDRRPALIFEADKTFDLATLKSEGYELFDLKSGERLERATHNNLALHTRNHRSGLEAVLAAMRRRNAS
jgi:hypothetical protein